MGGVLSCLNLVLLQVSLIGQFNLTFLKISLNQTVIFFLISKLIFIYGVLNRFLFDQLCWFWILD